MPRDTVSTRNFGSAVEKFTDAGITRKALIPVAPPNVNISPGASLDKSVLGKAPGRYNSKRDEWSGLYGSVVVDGLDPKDRDAVLSWPTNNVGILGRAYPGIDSDAETPAARRLVQEAIDEIFDLRRVAERIRGNNERRLYVLKARNPGKAPVRTRHVAYTLPDEGDVTHKLDIIGLGGQYLINGEHPSGENYGWHPEASLSDHDVVANLPVIEDADISEFLDLLQDKVRDAGGEWNARQGVGKNEIKDPADLDPTFDNATIFKGLDKLPNNEANFPHRDDLVSFLAAARAAAGRNSTDPDFEDELRAWATSDPTWCDDAYFDKVWDSLDRGVRATPDTLDRIFKRNGIFHQAAQSFDSDSAGASAAVKDAKSAAKAVRGDVLAQVASQYVFRDVNTADDNSRVTMRNAWDVAAEWPAHDWFMGESTRSGKYVGELHAEYGPKKGDFFPFIRDLAERHPECFYFGFTLDPFHDYGEIVDEFDADAGRSRAMLNLRHLPATIREARKADKNPARSAKDVQTILEFVNRLFGRKLAEYELDTLAFMVQKKRRPGCMLFLVGEPGVGKSTYTQLNLRMFNGSRGNAGIIDGTKLVNPNSARFALSGIEGCRIVSIKEMPKGRQNSKILADVTATLKQLVDPGIEGDMVQVERKGKDLVSIRNHARVLLTSNHNDSLEIEAGDRRIFMAEAQITQENRPDQEYYEEINAIIDDPERLAAFYRYLETRPVSHYSPNKAPPSSSAKQERIIAAIANPVERHMRAAMAWLHESGRVAFDRRELTDLMTECAAAEFANTGGGTEAPVDYTKAIEQQKPDVAIIAGLRPLGKLLHKPEMQLRSSKSRAPTIYFFKEFTGRANELDQQHRSKMQDFIYDEQDRGVLKSHPWALFRGKGD